MPDTRCRTGFRGRVSRRTRCLLSLAVCTAGVQAFVPGPYLRAQAGGRAWSTLQPVPRHQLTGRFSTQTPEPELKLDPTVKNAELVVGAMPSIPKKLPKPYMPEQGVGLEATLTKVLALNRGDEFVRVMDDEMALSAVQKMNEQDADCCLVFSKGSPAVLQGIFTERDYVRKIMEAKRKTSETPIVDVMTSADRIITGNPCMTLGDSMTLMVQNKVRHLPVVDEYNTVKGVISTTDLVKTMKKDDESLGGQFPIGELDEFMIKEVIALERQKANELAVKGGEKLGTQDLVRGGFVAAGAAVLALLLQGDFLHDHEVLAMVGIFCLGYLGIVLENIFEFNKAAVGMLMASALWVIYAGTAGASGIASSAALGQLAEHVAEVSEIIFFLLGAMTIVEIVDAHQGFRVVTDFIKTKSKKGLMWTIGILAFVMSSVLDNLTTTIVMVSLLRKLVPNTEARRLFGALVVIAANAGGAWTPIGDVTTTMLWINGQITALATMKDLVLPSAVSMVVSCWLLTRNMDKEDDAEFVREVEAQSKANAAIDLAPRGKLVFATGLIGLLTVPVFKALTGLPPYLGMLTSLGVLWVLTDAIHAGDEEEGLRVPAALSKIDVSGILFFFGILLSIGALDSAGILKSVAVFLQQHVPSEQIIATAIGMASAVIDNVPLVAATMGMYDLQSNPQDSPLWQLVAYCAGTGGSLLVIGSAAGVALMGMEKVDFLWYAKKITGAAFAGYLSGIATYPVFKFGIGGTIAQLATVALPVATTLLTKVGVQLPLPMP